MTLQLKPGDVYADHMQVVELIGQGAFACVYKVSVPGHARPLALKLSKEPVTSSDQAQRALREITILRSLSNPHIVRTYDCGLREDGHIYMLMDLLEGQPLDQWHDFTTPLEPVQALTIVHQMCLGLAEANAKGIVQFSAPLAHLITGGADFMLVPSRFEPCGLIQLHAMRYGTVPIVSSTGGLVDTVKEGVTGYHIGRLDPDDLLPEDVEAVASTAERAISEFGTAKYEKMRENCMAQELTWSKPAKKWEGVLELLQFGDDADGSVSSKKEQVTTPAQEM